MGGSSTHHIAVTKRMMARKKASRTHIKSRRVDSMRGKFGDMKANKLAERFRKTVRKDVIKERTYSLAHKIDILLYFCCIIAVAILLWKFLGYV